MVSVSVEFYPAKMLENDSVYIMCHSVGNCVDNARILSVSSNGQCDTLDH